jgi:hypothetical protein
MTGEETPLLRRPIVSGCAWGVARPNNLGICLELQARMVVASVGARVLRKGERQMVSSRLVDASCELGEGLCQDILCLVRWVGFKHAVGPSGVGECPRTETREGCMRRGTGRIVGGHRVATRSPWERQFVGCRRSRCRRREPVGRGVRVVSV